MTIATLALVARLTSDFLPVAPPVAVPQPPAVVSPAGAGTLSVSVSAAAPVGSVPQGASHVRLLTLDLSAGCDAPVTVSEIDVRHTGLGDAGDIAGLYVMDGTRRASRAMRFDADGTARLRVRSLTVEACGAKHLEVLADFSRDAAPAGEHGAEVRAASDIVSSAKTTTLTTADNGLTVATAAASAGTVTVKFLDPPSRLLQYGRTETVARVQLSADTTSDQLLRSITFTNREGARDYDLLNLFLQTSAGQTLTDTAGHMSVKRVTLHFQPSYVLRRGQTVVLQMKAQIHGSITRKVDFTLEEESDLDAASYRSRN